MSPRLKKAIGSFVILVWLVFYAGAAGRIGAAITEWPRWIELIYYVVAGVAWIIPLRPLMLWMNREPSRTDQSA